jgi:hypothetical protein
MKLKMHYCRNSFSKKLLMILIAFPICALAVDSTQQPPLSKSSEPPPIKKLGENLLQLGNLVVDTRLKEVTAPGHFLRDQVLEFIACTKNSSRSYESAIEIDTDAVTYNLALIMIGLERSRSVVPRHHFDLIEPEGDEVEIFIELNMGEKTRRIRAEELLYDTKVRRKPPMGTWVYTGSEVMAGGRYRAETDGILISFVHDPGSIIENVVGAGIGAYGTIQVNPDLKISPGTAVKLIVKAASKKKPD